MYIILNPIKIPDDCDIIVDGINYAGHTTQDSHWNPDGTVTINVTYSESHSNGVDPFGNALGSFSYGINAVTLSLEQTTTLKAAMKRADIKNKEDQIKRLQAELVLLNLSSNPGGNSGG